MLSEQPRRLSLVAEIRNVYGGLLRDNYYNLRDIGLLARYRRFRGKRRRSR